MQPRNQNFAGVPDSGDNNPWQALQKAEKQLEQQLSKAWISKTRKELGIASVKLSERDRTRGREASMASTHAKYLAAIRERGANELIPTMDRLRICTKGSPEPSKRLEELASLLARLDELDLDQEIFSDLTLTGQVDAVCASLKARTRLCRLCLSVSEQIATITGRMGEIGLEGIMWPPREFGTYAMESFTDGVRLLPPEKVDDDSERPFNVIGHHVSGATLLESAQDCPFCELLRIAIILDSFRQRDFPLDKPTYELPEMMLAIRRGKGLNDEFEQILEGIRSSRNAIYLVIDNPGEDGGNVLGHFRVVWQKPASMAGREGDRKVVFTKLKVFTSEPDDLAQFISSMQPLRDSGSIEALSQVNQWLEKCRANHHRCRDTISHQPLAADELNKLPSRVIDVGATKSDPSVRLLETANSSEGHWVALSHCWGKKNNHPLKTTRANLPQHLKDIPISALPKTFRDAVVATRALGFRYLWIDSLCIVQDDEDDWEKESQMMATIYEHAVITLAASAAVDSTQGLFFERPYAKIQFPSIQFPFVVRDEDSGRRKTLGNYSISLDWRQEPFMQHLDPMFSSIYLRGWCTQELILSRRVAHFLDEGMVWVCKQTAVDETGQFLIGGKRHSEGDWATEWGRIISEHSMRMFTFEKDRLISLDGLAREVSKATNNSCKLEEYFYGTWLTDIPEYILWASYRMDDRKTKCPSWSWASCASSVWLRFRDFDNNRPDDGLVRACKVLSVDRAAGILTVSAIRVDIGRWELSSRDRVSTQDLNGKEGRLAYRQPLIQGYGVSSTDLQVTGWIEFDDDRDALRMTEPVFYLHLGKATYWSGPTVQYWGLLVEKHPTRDGAFKRVGMGSLLDFEYSRTLERQDTAIA